MRIADRVLAAAALAVVTAGCAGLPGSSGVTTEQLTDRLDGPTQVVQGPDGRPWVAQLAGGEAEGVGQVVEVGADGSLRVLADGLRTPTGLAVTGDHAWVMEHTTLARYDLADDGTFTGRAEIATDLPSNGRSEGTLIALDDGRLLASISGVGTARTDPADQEGSRRLAVVDVDAAELTDASVVTGAKFPYAVAPAGDGRIWVTEVSDGPALDGPAPDELNLVEPGADLGWPRCIDPETPVPPAADDAAACSDTAAPVATLGVGATPTGVAVPPWDPEVALVARWVTGDVVRVNREGEVTPLELDVDRPQHLVTVGDEVWLTDHEAGTLVSLTGG